MRHIWTYFLIFVLILSNVGNVMGVAQMTPETFAAQLSGNPTSINTPIGQQFINEHTVFQAANNNAVISQMNPETLDMLSLSNKNQLKTQFLNSGQVNGMTPDKFKEFNKDKMDKFTPEVKNNLDAAKLEKLDNGQMESIVKDMEKGSKTAKNLPINQQTANALNKFPDKINNLEPNKINKLMSDKNLKFNQDTLNKINLESWKNPKDIQEFSKSLTEGGRTLDGSNAAKQTEAIKNSMAQEGPQQGAQQGEKGGDPAQMIQALAGGLIQALKPQEEKPEQQKDVNTPDAPKPGEMATKCAGTKCPRNACEQQIVTSDTGLGTVCCETACKDLTKTAQGQTALADISTAKAAASNQLTAMFAGQNGEKVTSLDQATKQDMTLLDQKTDKVIPTNDKVYVLNGAATNLYTLKGTEKGVKNLYRTFELDNTGKIKISIGEKYGATTIDPKGVFLWELPGTTVYETNDDSYKTDSFVYAPAYGIWIKATHKQGNAITGEFVSDFSFPTAGMTFNHNGLSNLLENAIDASFAKKDADVIILAKGYQDVDLLGNKGFFPVLIRKLAKGSTNIIYEINVAVQKRYMIKDNDYEYKIIKEEETTKVKNQIGKIIEDSGSKIIKSLSAKQKRLLYES